jgi:hypothetical protein
MQISPEELQESAERFRKLDDLYEEVQLFCSLNYLLYYPTDRDWREHWIRVSIAWLRDWIFKWIFTLLLLRRVRTDIDCWVTRVNAWIAHLDNYLKICRSKTSPVKREDPLITDHGNERLAHLFELLKILDGKFSMLLTINSVMVAILGLAIKSSTDAFGNFQTQDATGVHRDWFGLGVFFAICIPTAMCLSNIWHTIRGFRRLVWGDLGKNPYQNRPPGEGEPDGSRPKHLIQSLQQAESDFSLQLILSLIRRTCVFRVIAQSTRYAFAAFVLYGVVGLGTEIYRIDKQLWNKKPRVQANAGPSTANAANPHTCEPR